MADIPPSTDMASAVHARRGLSQSERTTGGANMFNLFPKMIIPVIIYAIVAFMFGFGDSHDNFTGNLHTLSEGACVSVIDGAETVVDCKQGVLNSGLFSVNMAGGSQWVISSSDILIVLGLLFLFIEMLKAPSTGNSTLVNNLLSTMVFVVALLAFVLHPLFATSTFFILMLMTLVDTMAGWFITAISARRDWGTGA
ncbi:hypothetical protein [Woodsholea maritima]|uniref:hypothetical protein n=1 Tax=Woodsholea maritima TaxID=240237 RepID=UPI000368AB69|nr:hypothetical protein [Woodsholea maritima]